jgi:hypothetical protein
LAIFGLVVRGGVSAILSAFPGPRRPAGPVGLSAVLFHFQKIKFTVGKYDFTSQFLLGQSKAMCESAKSAPSGVIFRSFLPRRAGDSRRLTPDRLKANSAKDMNQPLLC